MMKKTYFELVLESIKLDREGKRILNKEYEGLVFINSTVASIIENYKEVKTSKNLMEKLEKMISYFTNVSILIDYIPLKKIKKKELENILNIVGYYHKYIKKDELHNFKDKINKLIEKVEETYSYLKKALPNYKFGNETLKQATKYWIEKILKSNHQAAEPPVAPF